MLRFLIILLLLPITVDAQVLNKDFTLDNEDVPANTKTRQLSASLKGDSTEFSITAWGDECLLKIKDLKSIGSTKLYERPDGLEWETTLNQKPQTNLFIYRIETRGLNFFYQDTLNDLEREMHAHRPDSVVGSYAVYHSSKANNRVIIIGKDTTYENYKNGKAFHVYRPEAWDEKNDTVWCDLAIDIKAGLLTITIPQEFLDQAEYPVIIDPQFGNTTPGGSALSLGGYAGTTDVTMAASSGQVLDSVVWYGRRASGDPATVFGAIYTDDSGPDALGEGEETGAVATENVQWWEIPMAGTYALTASTTYWLAVMSTNHRVWYDASGTGEFKVASSWPDPFGAASSGAYSFSIYGVYSAGEPAVQLMRRRRTVIILNGDK